MGKGLRDQWKQIRGNAKWAAITILAGWLPASLTVIMTTLVTWWGWVLGLPGPYLVVLALAIVALCITIANGLWQSWVFRQWERGLRPLPLSTELTTERPQERFKTLSHNPPRFTGPQVAAFISNIQPYSKIIKIKIVTSQEHLEFAKLLASAFRTAGFTFEIDRQKDEDVFLATTKHDQFVVRYPARDEAGQFYSMLAYHCVFSPAYESKPFPKESAIDYFQIEIGGAP